MNARTARETIAPLAPGHSPLPTRWTSQANEHTIHARTASPEIPCALAPKRRSRSSCGTVRPSAVAIKTAVRAREVRVTTYVLRAVVLDDNPALIVSRTGEP
jgi:hypothetical protein